MSVELQLRQLTSTLRLGIVPLIGELIFDSDVRKPFMGDGTTVGGVPADGALTTGNNSASYAIVQGDVGKNFVFTYNSGAIAVSMAQAASSSGQYFPDGCLIWISNQSPSRVLTLTPATSTINGAATLVLNPGDSAKILSDGTNYWAIKCLGSGGTLAGLSDVSITSPANGDVLTYNTGTSKWDNAPSAGGGGGVSTVLVFAGSSTTIFGDTVFLTTSSLAISAGDVYSFTATMNGYSGSQDIGFYLIDNAQTGGYKWVYQDDANLVLTAYDGSNHILRSSTPKALPSSNFPSAMSCGIRWCSASSRPTRTTAAC